LKKIAGIIIDIGAGIILGAGLVEFFYFIVRRLPYRFAERIDEIWITDLLPVILLIVLAAAVIYAVFAARITKTKTLLSKFTALLVILLSIFVIHFISANILHFIYGKHKKKFNNFVQAVISEYEEPGVVVFDNKEGFDHVLVAYGLLYYAKDINERINDEKAAKKLEFIVGYEDDYITIKATKGNMVFRRLIKEETNYLRLDDDGFIVKTGNLIQIRKSKKGRLTKIEDIR